MWILLVIASWTQQSMYLTGHAAGVAVGKCHTLEAISEGFDQMFSKFVDIVCFDIMNTAWFAS